jgi:tRNA-splicing ligase RtcB
MARKKDAATLNDDILRPAPLEYWVWGAEYIDPEALTQMDNAMRLPVSVAGALMPDAHVGYGLPIGGVLATTPDTVIPYAVGVDIACRMRLSIYPASPGILIEKADLLEWSLVHHTRFGAGGAWETDQRAQHPVLDDPAWSATPLLKSLHTRAREQLGTSGSGNHFVEWGLFTLNQDDDQLGLKAGEYLALLSHSGSRGPGYQIAEHYSKLAMSLHPRLDQKARHLAWLSLDTAAGQEYWLSMELAGKYASANHYVIHERVSRAMGLTPITVVENHHNFAWREIWRDPATGTERTVIIHRKGATPAHRDVLGVIPGSMGDPGFVMRGRGEVTSLNSAAHGAGRALSRKAAMKEVSRDERDRYLKERGVRLLSAGLDESPQAYKPIEAIIEAQSGLIEIVGRFQPRIVRMDR